MNDESAGARPGRRIRRWGIVLIAAVLALGLFALLRSRQPGGLDPSRYRLQEIVSGYAFPVYLTHAGDGSGRLFVVEQSGRIYVMSGDGTNRSLFLDISEKVTQRVQEGYSEQGLLGLAFHPDYAENGEFFVHYTDTSGLTAIERYLVSADDPNSANPESGGFIFTRVQPHFTHNGGQIAFGPDGYFYIGLGDGGSEMDPWNNAQNPQELLGKILRVDLNTVTPPYSIPPDNPVNTVNPELAPEVWVLGVRNPWRFSFDSLTGDLYIGDVGATSWEEINFQAADSAGGENYGWRIMQGSLDYSGETNPGTMSLPVAEYSHDLGCAVSGGYVYRGAVLPDLQGVYFYGDFCSGRIWSLVRDAEDDFESAEFMSQTGLAITSFGQDEAGELYVVNYGGSILRLVAA